MVLTLAPWSEGPERTPHAEGCVLLSRGGGPQSLPSPAGACTVTRSLWNSVFLAPGSGLCPSHLGLAVFLPTLCAGAHSALRPPEASGKEPSVPLPLALWPWAHRATWADWGRALRGGRGPSPATVRGKMRCQGLHMEREERRVEWAWRGAHGMAAGRQHHFLGPLSVFSNSEAAARAPTVCLELWREGQGPGLQSAGCILLLEP